MTALTQPEDLTPQMLTEILRREGSIRSGKVAVVKVILDQELKVSRVARLAIGYSPNTRPQGPGSLFLKLSKNDAPGTLNQAEVDFYQRVQKVDPDPAVIRCYDARFSQDPPAYHILLEDLSNTHFQTSTGRTPSPYFSRLAVESLARFHARWHHDARLGNKVGVIFDGAWLKSFTKELEDSVVKFVEHVGDGLSVERRKTYEQMLKNSGKIWGRLTQVDGLTVTHGDTHWWNFLYPQDSQRNGVKLFDWQLWHIDLGARDLAFLLALGGFGERRRKLEKTLTRVYHEVLLASGVRGYLWDEFWRDYRSSAIRNLNYPVILWSRGRSRDDWEPLLERAFLSYDELKCSEILT